MTESWQSARARLSAVARHHPEQDTTELRQALRDARAEDAVRKVVESWPPLSDETRQRLAAILAPARQAVSR